MKKRYLSVLMLILSVIATALCGCEPKEKESVKDMPYQDILEQTTDQEFSFSTSLVEEKKIYPLSQGKSYYVSNNGDDNNDGLSEDKPIKTIAKANTLRLVAGDSLLFKCGETFTGNLTYSAINGADDNPITIASYGEGERPILTNENPASVIEIYKASNVVVRDLYIKPVHKTREETSQCISGISFSYQYVKEEKFKNIYICDNVVKGNGIGANIMGIDVTTLENTHDTSPVKVVSNCYIVGNEVSNLGRSGIHCGGWLMRQKNNQNEGHLDKFVNFHFDNNIVYDVGAMGVYIVACTDSTILRNKIFRAGVYYKNEVMEGQAGIMALSVVNCDIMFNDVYECSDGQTGYDAMGIDIDWNTYNVNVQYNYCHDNKGSGIGTMANQSCFIRNNKVENNLCGTNNFASLFVCNFTSRYDAVREDWHSVQNLLVEENLVIHNVADKYAFGVRQSNGDQDFKGNQFVANRVMYVGDEASKFVWVSVDPNLAWNRFANNRYYSYDNSKFICLDFTPVESIDTVDGAEPYAPTKSKAFAEWQKRDVNSTYELIETSLIPSNPTNPQAKYEDNQLTISWDGKKADSFWHYNIYKVHENENISYTNMLMETKENSFSFSPSYKEECYFIIQPESNQGTLGKALKVKVTLK